MGPHGVRAIGADNAVDQVKRLNAFRKAHPAADISSPRQNGLRAWQATWSEAGISTTVTRLELRDLLDELDRRFG